MDGGGRVFVAGTTWGSINGVANSGGSDGFLVRYDYGCQFRCVWNNIYTKLLGSSYAESFVAMAMDGAQDAYVAGTKFVASQNDNLAYKLK